MLTGDAYFLGHLTNSHLGLTYVLIVETNPFPDFVLVLNIPRYFYFTSNLEKKP